MLAVGIRRGGRVFAQLRLNHILLAAAAAAVAVVTAERLWLARDLPLWLDETWTAMIVSQPTWGEFWRQVWLDCNAPLYYLLMRLWEGVAGQSDWALRIPSLLFVTAAGLLPVFWRPPAMTRETALTWAALLTLWWPGMAVSLDARAYSLLLLVSVAQTIAFARALDRPDLKTVMVWSGLASLAILTHYYALYLAGVQGLLLLALKRPWRTWPAALLFLPAFAWIAIHLPRLTDYVRPDVAWYEPVGLSSAGVYVRYIFGPNWILFPSLVAALAVAAVLWKRPRLSPLWIVAGAGALAVLLALTAGAIRPSMTPRYLIPMIPAVLLGLTLAVQRSGAVSLTLILLFFATMLTPQIHARYLHARSVYGYERQSEWLMAARPDQLVFAWDHPANRILEPDSLARIGGYFFRRAGQPVETTAVILKPSDDPYARLPQAARGERPAIIWIYNTARNTAARRHPPHALPGWRCTATEGGPTGVIACVRE